MKRNRPHLLQHSVSTSGGDTVAEERPKDEQYFTRVRCEVKSMLGQHEEVNRKGLDSELHPVIVHQTRPITIWVSLDLSILDRTLVFCVRSFSLARQVASTRVD